MIAYRYISWFLLALTLAACGDAAKVPIAKPVSALIIIDMQYDFLPGGTLETSGGDQIIGPINQMLNRFDLVVATQDWHPPGHGSFASVHPGMAAGEVIDLNGIVQVLWPDHAVQESHGAQLTVDLQQEKIARVFRKGTNPEVDSYSGFFDNGTQGDTGLDAYLKSRGVTDVYVVGLALDYCVKYTALDAAKLGYKTTLVEDATRAVNLYEGDGAEAVQEMRDAGVNVTLVSDL